MELFKQEKRSRASTRKVLRELGAHPSSGAQVNLLEGRYGPYVTDGTTNASLPKDDTAEQVTLERAVELLAARAESGGGRPRASGARRSTGTRRAGARRSTARKRTS